MNQECRLYLITPPIIDDIEAFTHALKEALDGGDVACLQIRLKSREGVSAPDDHIVEIGRRIIPIAQEKGVAVLINDRPDLAKKLKADGVHIGQEDASIQEARQILGEDAIVGVTCHDSRHLALEAGEGGADYVAFGAFYPTQTKDPKSTAEIDTLTWWQQFIELPCVAIGGITVENANPIIEAGADFIAVSSGVWNYEGGPKNAVSELNKLMHSRG